ncbi:hypothetical protein M404DRAFT_1004699 [Pisolithus tinctorius Marx 270]|uniref:Uncharacterized protein n=1 Tax=Pisolithus tinctorius Marx 270 TaxID=870435 RepID=A0A0C3JPM5_PISTI|nr:hypothetical protein M404DRAFT_1004699 [Pisolithus tinctorius Marx 270]
MCASPEQGSWSGLVISAYVRLCFLFIPTSIVPEYCVPSLSNENASQDLSTSHAKPVSSGILATSICFAVYECIRPL